MSDFDLIFPQKQEFISRYKHGKTDISTQITDFILALLNYTIVRERNLFK